MKSQQQCHPEERKSAIQAYGKDLKLEKLVSSLERGSGDQASSLACGDRVASGFPIPKLRFADWICSVESIELCEHT